MIALALWYLILNGLLYIAILRRSQWIQTESGIFIYQLLSFAFFVLLIAFAAFGRDPLWDAFLWTCVALGFHGILSLTFLELWSLTEGSYSLSILTYISTEKGHATVASLGELSAIGGTKSDNRSGALVAVGLMVAGANPPKLTFAGRMLSNFFKAIVALTNGRQLNR